ncbi:MAG: hypothetical protein Q9M26_01625 [Mariprofundales bacterium]|nr:hypothetical protein [Mariprofundales bacterium]
MRWSLLLLPLLFGWSLLLNGCDEKPAWIAPTQKWQDFSLHVETRPTTLLPGMNEFLVMASRQQHGFVNDLVVHIRTTSSRWRQAIPDGALGVYRRALPVRDLKHGQLFVRLDKDGTLGELVFPLAPAQK